MNDLMKTPKNKKVVRGQKFPSSKLKHKLLFQLLINNLGI